MSEAYPSWPAGTAWLYTWVDTDSPGYRKMETSAGTLTIPAGHHAWWDLIDELDTLVQAATTGGVSVESDGTVDCDLAGDTYAGGDRLPWLLGFDRGPETGVTSVGSNPRSVVPPPGGLPLMEASWERIDRRKEEQLTVDRHLRGHGYVWGAADVWRIRLMVHREVWRQLRTRWATGGKVTVSRDTVAAHQAGTPTAWSGSNPTGYLTGHALGVEAGGWVDQAETWWRGTLLLTVEV